MGCIGFGPFSTSDRLFFVYPHQKKNAINITKINIQRIFVKIQRYDLKIRQIFAPNFVSNFEIRCKIRNFLLPNFIPPPLKPRLPHFTLK